MEMGERGWPVALTRVQVGSRHRAVGRERSRPRYSFKARIMVLLMDCFDPQRQREESG